MIDNYKHMTNDLQFLLLAVVLEFYLFLFLLS